MQDHLIIYHKNCWDGLTAAWLTTMLTVGDSDDRVEHLAASYGDPPPDEKTVAGKRVWIVDFSYPIDTIRRLQAASKSLALFDHHATAIRDLAPLAEAEPNWVLDPTRSGARLVWDELPRILDRQRPWRVESEAGWLVDYVEDRDLWRRALPDCDAIIAAIRSHPITFEGLAAVRDLGLEGCRREGRGIQRYRGLLVEERATAGRLFLARHRAGDDRKETETPFVVAYCDVPDIVSDLGHALLDRFPIARFAAISSVSPFGDRVGCSLRSRSPRHPAFFDVADLAERLGGGGHPSAAGFSLDLDFLAGPSREPGPSVPRLAPFNIVSLAEILARSKPGFVSLLLFGAADAAGQGPGALARQSPTEGHATRTRFDIPRPQTPRLLFTGVTVPAEALASVESPAAEDEPFVLSSAPRPAPPRPATDPAAKILDRIGRLEDRVQELEGLQDRLEQFDDDVRRLDAESVRVRAAVVRLGQSVSLLSASAGNGLSSAVAGPNSHSPSPTSDIERWYGI